MSKKKKKNSKKAEPIASTPVGTSSEQTATNIGGNQTKSREILKWAGVLVAFLLIVFSAVFFFLKRQKGPVFGQYKGYNVLLVTLDTTRADHLPAYGYTQVKTPNLDRFAGESLVFEDAISHAPLTLPSHTSILTGLLPITHGVRDNGGYFVDPKDKTIADVLKGNGYTTSAFVSAYVLISSWGLGRGFDFYYDDFNEVQFTEMNPRDIQRRGDETEAEFEHWLEANKDKRFFSWVHFFDPHDPYEPPEPFKTEYARNPYDGEIAFTDEVLGRLFKKLEDLHLKDRTIVVITGDHGEGLGEHQEMTHSMFVYNATQHIPLFIYLPGGKKQRIPATVRHIDIAPTILQLVGVQPLKEMQGISLLPLINGSEKRERMGYSESIYAEAHYGWSPLYSLATEKYRYVEAPRPELYDRINDPGELHNLISEKPAIAKVLRKDLQELMTSSTRKDLKGPQKMDPETEEKLRALGYVSGTVEATKESRLIDPKDKIQLTQYIQQAYAACMNKDYKRAIDYIAPVLKEGATMSDGHFIAGIAYGGAGEYKNAIDELMKTIRVKPDHTLALYNLGYAYQALGDLKSAEFWYLKTLDSDEKNISATIKLAALYRYLGEPEKAKPYFASAVKFYQDALGKTNSPKARTTLYTTLGEIYFSAGDLDAAEKSLNSAIDLTPGAPNLHYNLAQIYEARGQTQDAIQQYQKEIEMNPANFRAYNNLGLLYQKQSKWNDAIGCFQKVIQLHPQDPHGYTLLASLYKSLGKDQEAAQLIRQWQGMEQQVNR